AGACAGQRDFERIYEKLRRGALRDHHSYSAKGEYGSPDSPSTLCARPFGRARARIKHQLRSRKGEKDRQAVGTRSIACARKVVQPARLEESLGCDTIAGACTRRERRVGVGDRGVGSAG